MIKLWHMYAPCMLLCCGFLYRAVPRHTISCHTIYAKACHCRLGPLLLTWINFNPSMDKCSHAQEIVRWNYLSIHKLEVISSNTLHGYNCLSMLELKLIHVNKMDVLQIVQMCNLFQTLHYKTIRQNSLCEMIYGLHISVAALLHSYLKYVQIGAMCYIIWRMEVTNI